VETVEAELWVVGRVGFGVVGVGWAEGREAKMGGVAVAVTALATEVVVTVGG